MEQNQHRGGGPSSVRQRTIEWQRPAQGTGVRVAPELFDHLPLDAADVALRIVDGRAFHPIGST